MIEQKLRHLFDFQKFAGSKRLGDLIHETEKRQGHSLSEDELSYVNAAGIPAMMNIRDQDRENKDDPWNQ